MWLYRRRSAGRRRRRSSAGVANGSKAAPKATDKVTEFPMRRASPNLSSTCWSPDRALAWSSHTGPQAPALYPTTQSQLETPAPPLSDLQLVVDVHPSPLPPFPLPVEPPLASAPSPLLQRRRPLHATLLDCRRTLCCPPVPILWPRQRAYALSYSRTMRPERSLGSNLTQQQPPTHVTHSLLRYSISSCPGPVCCVLHIYLSTRLSLSLSLVVTMWPWAA